MQEYMEIILKLLLATLFGGLIGLERETHGRAAGLRTHILVCVGSCLIMLTSLFIYHAYKHIAPCDPGRIAAGVVTGIGFLGAGTILRYRGSVMGLTTAASIWTVAAIGLATGSGFYYAGILTTVIVLITLFFISKLEYVLIRKDWYKTLVIESKIDENQLHSIREALERYNAVINKLEIEKIPERNLSRVRFDIKLTSSKFDDNIILRISNISGVHKALWE